MWFPNSEYKESVIKIRTEYIDSMGADNVLCQLHVNAVTYHNQWSLVGCNNCSNVWSCDPAPFRRYHSATCCISNMSASYKPFDLCRWVAVGCCTCEGHRIAYPGLCWTRDANLSWSNCVSTTTKNVFQQIYSCSHECASLLLVQ